MRLTSFEARHVRRFSSGIRIDGFDPGINVFAGPNGSGKSTIVRALQAAFVERYQTRQVDDLVPWSAPGSSPAVLLEFDHNEQHYELHKQFLKGAFARLQVGGKRLENQLADDAVAELLGFRLVARGRNKADNLGIPGLLWISQGSGQLLDKPLTSARQYLRDALGEHVGELTTADGDAVLEQIRRQRNELLAVNSDKPKGDYERAVRELASVSQRVEELKGAQVRYAEMVDQLAQFRDEEQQIRVAAPWDRIASELAAARQALGDGEALKARLQEVTADKLRIQSEIALLETQLQAWQQQRQLLDQRRKGLELAATEVDDASAHFDALGRIRDASLRDLTARRTALDRALRLAERQALKRDHDARREALTTLEQQMRNANGLQKRISALRVNMPAHSVDAADVARAAQLEQDLAQTRAQRDANATLLQWELLDDQSVTLDGQPVDVAGERLLSEEARVDIRGIGKLLIQPGGADRQQVLSGIAHAEQESARLLSRYQVDTVQALERLAQQQAQDEREIQLLGQQLAQFAPDGLEQLRDRIAAARSQLDEIKGSMATPDTDGDADDYAATDHQVQADALRVQLADLERQSAQSEQRWQEARTRVALATAARIRAQQELNELEASVAGTASAPGEHPDASKMAPLKAALTQREEQLGKLGSDLEKLRLDAIAQDIERLTKSQDAARDGYEQVVVQCRTLEGRLSEAGANGDGERLAIEEAERARLTRRVAQFDQRARAVSLLLDRLESARQQATEQLLAPLRRHLDHYLGLLFPGARLDMNEELLPTVFLERDASQAASGSFEEQSFGTREQLALIARLAYADLLKLAGRPTLIVLDDGLVHSDRERLRAMKRILFDAAQRHQVLIFTCHQDRWQDLGAPVRDIRNCVLQESTG